MEFWTHDFITILEAPVENTCLE